MLHLHVIFFVILSKWNKLQPYFNDSNTFGTVKIYSKQGYFELMSVSDRSGGMKECCVFSLKSPGWGDSNEYTQYTIFNIKKEFTLKYPKSVAMGFVQGTQEWVRNRCSCRKSKIHFSFNVTIQHIYID